MPKTMPVQPERLRVNFTGRPKGVDRKNNRLLGYVVAQEGPFKSEGRGEFDRASLEAIAKMMADKALGLKARFEHPSASGDTLGKFLGRSVNPSLDSVTARSGQKVLAVRADLQLDPTSFETPNGNLGKYVLDLAESDPDALSSSLVLAVDKEFRLNPDGTRMLGPDGDELPPLWRPTKLYASDIVDEGDAVDGILSTGGDWSREALAKGAELLDKVFAGQTRDVVQARAAAWLERYLDLRYGELLEEEGDESRETTQKIVGIGFVDESGNGKTLTSRRATEILRRRLRLKEKQK